MLPSPIAEPMITTAQTAIATITTPGEWLPDSADPYGGRTAEDAALSMCASAFGDLGYDYPPAIDIFAADGTMLAAKIAGGKCGN